ncbi:unnamed protein product [Ectocarpus sp. 6 AP-2014]
MDYNHGASIHLHPRLPPIFLRSPENRAFQRASKPKDIGRGGGEARAEGTAATMSSILAGASQVEDPLPEKGRLGPWLAAWHDPVAGLTCNGGCMQFMDLSRNGDYKLVVACRAMSLKVYQGTSIFAEHPLLDEPSGLCAFYGVEDNTNTAGGERPAVAVAAGPYIFIYKNLRPYFKFTAPLVEPSDEELEIWTRYRKGEVDADTLKALLTKATEDGVRLGPLSKDFLAPDLEERGSFLSARGASEPLSRTTIITCLATMNRAREEEGSPVCLLAGTEDGQIVFLDPPCKVLTTAQLPRGAVPAFLAVGGLFDSDWRLAVACRNGRIYTVKDGDVAKTAVVTGTVISLEATPCGLARLPRQVYAATTDNNLHAYHLKGRRDFSLKMPALVVQLEAMETRSTTCLLVALADGNVRLYDAEKNLLHTLKTQEPIAALRFGPYAREDGALAVVSVTGKLTIFMLNRKADLRKPKTFGAATAGYPPEQDIPLKVPKKTKLYVEQTQRAKLQAGEIHRAFQKDLCLLRLTAARAYVKTITDGRQGVSAVGAAASLRLHAQCQGLGPNFKIKLELQNQGDRALTNLPVAFTYDRDIYAMEKGQFMVSALIPGVSSRHEIAITNIDEGGAAGSVRILVLSPSGPSPLVSAVVNMPLSELIDS